MKTATRVGARRGRPLVLTVDAGAMHRAGHVFRVSANGVLLADAVPPEFLRLRRVNSPGPQAGWASASVAMRS
ncbi:RNA 2'-phosphotransferase [Streptomyces microflavus]